MLHTPQINQLISPVGWSVEYTDRISAEGYPSTTSILDMTLNNLMVRPQ